MSNRINYTPYSDLHVNLVQSWIDEGLTPESKPAMAGLVKKEYREVKVEVPGQRFRPVGILTEVLVPDREAIAKRVLKATQAKQEAKAAAVASVTRFDFIELDEWGNYCS